MERELVVRNSPHAHMGKNELWCSGRRSTAGYCIDCEETRGEAVGCAGVNREGRTKVSSFTGEWKLGERGTKEWNEKERKESIVT